MPSAVGLANWFYILGVGNSCAPMARIGALLEEVLGRNSAQDLLLGSQWFPGCLMGSHGLEGCGHLPQFMETPITHGKTKNAGTSTNTTAWKQQQKNTRILIQSELDFVRTANFITEN